MKVTIELLNGPYRQTPTKADMQRSIDAATKAKNGEPLNGMEQCLMSDVIGILRGLQSQLPGTFMEQGHRRG